MKNIIIINRQRYSRFVYWKYINKNEFNIYLILDDEFYNNFPKEDLGKYALVTKSNFFNTKYLVNLINELNIEVDVIVSWDEELLESIAELRSHYGLSAISKTEQLIFRCKDLMYEILYNSHRVPVSYSYKFPYLKQANYPIIIKPKNGAGSVNTYFFKNYSEFLEYKHLFDDTYIVNEYIEGKLFHIDSIYNGSEFIFFEACEYINKPLNYSKQGGILGSVTIRDKSLLTRLFEYNNEVLGKLGIHPSMYHMELFITDNDEIVFLEVANRPPGGEIMPMYEEMYGINIYSYVLNLQLGKSIKPIEPVNTIGFWFYVKNMDISTVKIIEDNFDERLGNEAKVRIKKFHVQKGEILNELNSNCYERHISIVGLSCDYKNIFNKIKEFKAGDFIS